MISEIEKRLVDSREKFVDSGLLSRVGQCILQVLSGVSNIRRSYCFVKLANSPFLYTSSLIVKAFFFPDRHIRKL